MSYYLRDLGITFYHILYQDQSIRQAFLAGYRAIRTLPTEHLSYLEAFLTWAAIENLAFQITLPSQHTSPIFARNLRQLADVFCARLITDTAFVLV
jgi:Ser/Thr protein kinase RdoA (MazF antagonist)